MDIFNNAKKLGFGLMRLPRLDPADEGSIDLEQTKQMVDTFLQRGFTYFDTAWMYCAFKSENAVKDVLTSRHPRESYTLATKLHAAYIHSLDDRDAIFNTQREKTGVDYFDYYLLHDMGAERYEIYKKYDCLSWIAEKKRQGLIKHMGFSFHDTAEVLDQILTEHPEMEFVQLQINYLDWDSEGVQSRKCYEVATKHGKPVIVMEPVKGGTLAKLPAAAEKLLRQADPEASVPSWAVRFAAGLPNVKMVLSGMSSTEQLLDNTGFMQDFVPLTQQEQAVIAQVVDTINASIAIPCTGCAYCTEGCPMHIAIPKYFSLYNADLQELKDKDFTSQGAYYDNLTLKFGKASDCIACGQCESVCPQHLPIIENLKRVAKQFEA